MTKKEVTIPTRPNTPQAKFSKDVQHSVERVLPEPTKRVCFNLPVSLHKRIKVQCAREGVHLSDVARQFFEGRFPKSEKVSSSDTTD